MSSTHEMKKKIISRYDTHKKFITTHKKGTGSEAGIGSGTVFFRFCINRHLSKKVHKINNYRNSHT